MDFKTSVGHQIQHSYKVHGPQNDSVRHQIQHSYKVHGPQNDSVRHQIQHSYKVHGPQNDSVRVRYSTVTKYNSRLNSRARLLEPVDPLRDVPDDVRQTLDGSQVRHHGGQVVDGQQEVQHVGHVVQTLAHRVGNVESLLQGLEHAHLLEEKKTARRSG